MARLPRSPIAQNVQNDYRPVREARATGADPVGAALEGAGNAGFEIASRIADAKIAADAAEASIKLRSRLDEEFRAIETDMEGDPAGFEARFRERAAAVANEEAGRLSSPAMRRAFGMKSQELTETFTINMRDVTRRRQIEGVKAQTMRIGADFEALANDTSKPRELLEQARDDYLALVDRELTGGIYTPDQAEALRIASEETYRSGITVRHLSNVDALLEAGRYGEAQEYFKASYGEISPGQREQAERALQDSVREGESIQTADRLWADSGENFNGALEAARQIENPQERLAVEGRLAQMKNQDDAGREAAQRDVRDRALMALTSGQRVPPGVWRDADGFSRDFIQNQLREREERAQRMATLSAQERTAMREDSGVSRDVLKVFATVDRASYIAGPSSWPENMQAEWNNMTETDQIAILQDMETKRMSGEEYNAVDKIFQDLIMLIPDMGPSNMRGSDFVKGSDGPRSSRRLSDEERGIRTELFRLTEEHARRTGAAPLKPDEARALIGRAFLIVDQKRYGDEIGSNRYPGGVGRTRLGPGSYATDAVDALRRRPEWIRTSEFLQQRSGREPTDEEVLAALRMAGQE